VSLQDALRDARRFHRGQDDETARRREEERDRVERERQLRLEAVGYLKSLGGEVLVEVEPDEMCQYGGAFKDADRFRDPDGKIWRVVGEQRCWIAGDESGDVADPWLLLADGRVGRFIPHPVPLTRLDPRRDGHQGREFVSRMPLGEPPRWALTEQLLAYMIVRYERARASAARGGGSTSYEEGHRMDNSEHTLTTLVGVMADMLRREQRGDRLTVEIGPHAALTLVAALQQVMGEGAQTAVYAPAVDSFLAELRRAFAAEPDVLALLQYQEVPAEPQEANSGG
jgi:hypothetical protein